MTDNEKKARIREINKLRDELRKEKEEYEKYFFDKEKHDIKNEHKGYIGKCFKVNILTRRQKDNIIAFKILSIDENDANYGECIIITTSTEEKGIYRSKLGLWVSASLQLMQTRDTLKFIDYYTEIDQETFDKTKNNILNSLEA